MNTGQMIIIGISILMGVWYVVGATINRRRGVATYQWLQAELEQVGKVTEAKWIGSSGTGARLLIGNALKPFRRVEVIFLLESREIMPLWVFNRIRGKQDEMVLKANLRTVPTQEIEIARGLNRKIKNLMTNPDEEQAPFEQGPESSAFTIAMRGRGQNEFMEDLQSLLEKYRDALLQVSVRRKMPHLIIRVRTPPLMADADESFFDDLSNWLAGGKS